MSSRKRLPGDVESPVTTYPYGDTNSFTRKPAELVALPPDEFASLKPCSHIQTVLDSRAKETVFLTYRQAVNISQTISDERHYTQKKDGTTVPNRRLVNLKSESLHCSDCSINNFHYSFICLQCPHVGCPNGANHAHVHFKQTQHFFAIDSSTGLLYCFMCGDYINDPQLDQIRLETLHHRLAAPSLILTTSEAHQHYTMPSYRATTGLKGFVNLGSTCFMSCILQSFIHNPIIRNHFFNNDVHFFNCASAQQDGAAIDETNACVTCSIDTIFKNFYTATDIGGFGITNLLLTAWFKKKSLAGFQEQDAHEFWQFLLDELHKDHCRVTGAGAHEPSEPCHCITHTCFSGELESSIRCTSCDSVTNTVDPTVDLSLEIRRINQKAQSSLTLYDCLDLFTKNENLDLMYRCQYCGERAKAIKSLKIKKLPPVLGIQLKRFAHSVATDGSSKVETPVEIPLFIDLTRYTSTSAHDRAGDQLDDTFIDGNKVYELFAVICHVGSVNTGHYIAIIKNDNGQWFRFDDNVISLMSLEEVRNVNAYLLYYITHKI